MPRLATFTFAFTLVLLLVLPVSAEHTDPPDAVTLAGTFQAQLGCDSDWMPECEATQLRFDEIHQLWTAEFDLPAGEYEYKVAINNAWDESYGLNAEDGGANIPLSVAEDTTVLFLYNPTTHYVADNINRIIANLPGSWNAEVGCGDTSFDDPGSPGDWAPDCYQTLLEDPDGDGIYVYVTQSIPPGSYEGKVAINGSWGENYGEGGAQNGSNIGFTVAKPNADVVFTWDSDSKVLTVAAAGAPKGNLNEQAAYWIAGNQILTREDAENSFELHFSAESSLQLTENGVEGGEAFPLEAGGEISTEVRRKFPHLGLLTTLTLPEEAVARSQELLRGQLVLAVKDADGNPVTATGLQLPGIIDELFTYDGELGISWADGVPTFRLWAPTAQRVGLDLFADSAESTVPTSLDAAYDPSTGVWTVIGDANMAGQFYLWNIDVFVPQNGVISSHQVTDPYSVGLSTNSTRSHIIDLNSVATTPANWEATTKPQLDAFEDITLYELHVRDFSIIDETVPEDQRGTFAAFTASESNGMRHLSALADAGLSHVHLLPIFDIATIEEDRELQKAPIARFLGNFEGDSEQQQQAIFNLRDQDGFNWGYDPFHYTVPEGSYSTDPDGVQRIVELRQAVQSLNETGLRVVMDVVYNHTNANGLSEKSVLDKVVPGYYHRLNSKGKVENSTCCPNTATEHNMMRKLMVDSLVVWARDYKIDGFRFDLMGHHMIGDMQAVRDALDALTLEKDGVDGRAIYIYGEGWNFGEVASGQRGPNATQLAVGGMGIGTFNDRIRDAVRGGNPFGGELEQGFATGLLTNPNAVASSEGEQRITMLKFADQIRVGLTGNLADYAFENARGQVVAGSAIDYNGSATGYTEDPQEVINYASAHDNETLFDAVQLKLPLEADMATRVAHQNFALDLIMLGQGVPFFHAGSDILRSKSADRDSYNSGDWFNAIDWTYSDNNWAKGLPVADKNEAKWIIIQPLLANDALRAETESILANSSHFNTMLSLRNSSPLFRLRTADAVAERLRFHNTGPDQVPGLIVMSLDDSGETRIDPNFNRMVVLFNGRADAVEFAVPELAGEAMVLHPLLAESGNPLYAEAAYTDGTFTVPGVSTIVFVQAGDANAPLASEFAAPVVGEMTDNSADNTTASDTASATSEVEPASQLGQSVTPLMIVMLSLCVVGLAIMIVLLTAFIMGIAGVFRSDD